MSLTIRTMRPRDYDEVVALWRACPGVGVSDSDTREGIARFLRANSGLSFVALDDGRLVGAVLCGHDGRRGYLSHLGVAPGARRRGIGRELVGRCVAALAQEGIDKCHIFVFEENADALAFWRDAGWSARPELRVLSRIIAEEHA